jgi:hypothetical protein
MNTTEILQKLGNVQKTSNGWKALCPSHDDKKQSLSIKEADGKVLLKCFAACDVQNIVSALDIELKDLFSEPKKTMTNNNFQQKKILAVYPYTDENGELLYENVRFEPKDFRQRRFDENGKEVWSLNGTRRVPYRLPELIEGVKEDVEIWLCEGEKDADNLRSLGFTASSFKNWQREFNSHLKTAHVCLFQDHDKAGLRQANEAAKLLYGNVASLKVIDLFSDEPLPEKHGKDISDFIMSFAKDAESRDVEIAERLCILTDNAMDWKPEQTSEEAETKPEKQKGKFRFTFTTLDELYLEPEEETAFVWGKTLPFGGFSICSAKPKVGKSTIARNLAVAVSKGEPFLGRETIKGKVLYLCLEEKRNEVKKHFRQMGADGGMILIHSGACPQTSAEAIEALTIAIAEFEPVLVIIDPLSRVLRTTDFNDYRIAYALEPFIDLARKFGIHLLMLHHDGKGERDGGDAILGSTALFGAVDCHLQMKKRERGRTLSTIQRYGEDLPETVIELEKETGLIIEKGDLQTAIIEEIKDEVLNNLADSEMLQEADIKERCKGKGGTVSTAIRNLLKEHKLFREGEGKRGQPYLYGKVLVKEK